MGFLYSQLFVTPKFPTTSVEGQTVIVTGSNVGLGKEASRHFARLGAEKVILAVRNTKAGEEARKDIEESTGCADSVLEVWPLDLSSQESVKAFADRAKNLKRLDILLENAGVAVTEASYAEGHELTITVNVINTFLLALLLIPKLESSGKQFNIRPRLTIVSSEVHGWTKFPEWKEEKIFESLDKPTKKSMAERYQTSKLLEILVIRRIAPSLQKSGVVLNYINPGFCYSELTRSQKGIQGLLVGLMKTALARSTEVGSRTLVLAATHGPESHGKYIYDGQIGEQHLSQFVRSSDGDKASEKVWQELRSILEKSQPGISKSIE